jgi:oxygen-independent coproporphyrinogen-3 oxidase
LPAQHQFDANLLRAYDVNGPRYTSYPTALQFSEAFPVAAYGEAVRALPAQAPVSLYMHVPFCDTICYYCACNKIITNNRAHAERYLTRLCAEMSLHRANLRHDHVVEQLHFGGGTPTYLTNAQFETLFAALRSNFNLHDGAGRDYSIEIDPRTVDPARIAFLAELGLNRLSLGIQDFDPDVQRAINRIQSFDVTKACANRLGGNGVNAINVDLVYGLPKQSLESCLDTIDRVLELAPDRLSVFGYAHVPHMKKHMRLIDTGDLPGIEARIAQAQAIADRLVAAGYVAIGFDHYARPEDPLAERQRTGQQERLRARHRGTPSRAGSRRAAPPRRGAAGPARRARRGSRASRAQAPARP